MDGFYKSSSVSLIQLDAYSNSDLIDFFFWEMMFKW